MAITPFKNDSTQKAFGAIFSILGLFLTAIELSNPTTNIFEIPMLSVGFVIFLIGVFYLIEVTFR